MTIDIKIRYDQDTYEWDFIFENNDLVTDEGLVTAVIISWFTDQRATDDDTIPNSNSDQQFVDKRGWWGDLVDVQVAGDRIGSKLWLLDRAKTTQENLALAKEYGEAALEWMKEDGVAKDVIVTSEKIQIGNTYILSLKAEITKVDGNKLNVSFDPEWFATFNEN